LIPTEKHSDPVLRLVFPIHFQLENRNCTRLKRQPSLNFFEFLLDEESFKNLKNAKSELNWEQSTTDFAWHKETPFENLSK
jgi:hypothetical protein